MPALPPTNGQASTAPARSSPFDLLRQAGYRVTQQRAQLLCLLAAGCEQGEHLDAESLHRRAGQAGMEISLATVYRTLAIFREIGLVAQHHFGRDTYEAATYPAHHHFTCLRCGAVIEFEMPQVQALAREAAAQLGVAVTQGSLYIDGYCPACQAHDPPNLAG